LTVVLPGKTMPGTEDGPPRDFAWRGAGRPRDGGSPPACGSVDGRPASAAAPGSVRTREGAASADAPRRGQSPAFPADANGLAVLPVSVHAFPLGQLAPLALLPGCGPALARQRCALEAVEKVVTGPWKIARENARERETT
jgi:hypothetical protein